MCHASRHPRRLGAALRACPPQPYSKHGLDRRDIVSALTYL
jgi:hypothetical protein